MSLQKSLCTLTMGMLTTISAFGQGSIIISGHDADDHAASQFMNWAGTLLLTGGANISANPSTAGVSTKKIAYISTRGLPGGFFSGFTNVTSVLATSTTELATMFAGGYDLIVVGSGGDWVSTSAFSTLAAQQANFITYFNAGGKLLVLSESAANATFYSLVPSFGSTVSSVLPGCSSETGNGNCMRPSTQGTVRGHTLAQIVDADITHQRFSSVAPSFEILSTYFNNGDVNAGQAITIGAFGATAGSGGFTGGGGGTSCPLAFAGYHLANGIVGTAYSATVAGSCGVAPYHYQVTCGVIPPENHV